MIETANVMHHKVPAGMLVRVVMIAVGGALIVVGIQQALALTFPIDVHALPMVLTVAACLAFGMGSVGLALFAPERHWTIRRGMVEIDSETPFRRWSQQFDRREVVGFSVQKDCSGDGPATWVVVFETRSGKRFQTQHIKAEGDADKLLRRMQNAFYG